MSPAARLLSWPIKAYRLLLSPWLGTQCRFTPTCSVYALQALEHHGAWRGTGLATWRVLRCHPWCDGGHDPVPGLWPTESGGTPGEAAPASSVSPANGPPP